MFRKDQQIGLYTLVHPLGRGGFGEVWLAERRTKFVTTKVAVKLPLDEQVDHEAVKHEATLWEQASGHPNILPIIDADEYDGQIVSEYAPDGSLEQWLKTHGAMSVEKAVEMTIQILDGLEFLHSRNIIHRDLKPANILLQGKTPRLADFGISRALRTTVASQSQNISGTFAYMSPEALDGKRSIQTDVWSVGVNLYQFLTGTLPFPQKEPSILFPAIIMREFAPLPDSIPQNLKDVIAKALAKMPENRYASAGEIRENLRRVLRDKVVSDFTESDSQQTFAVEQIPSTQKIATSSAGFQDENETLIRFTPKLKRSKKRKNFKGWIYAILAWTLVGTICFGSYFLIKQLEQDNLSKSQNIVPNESNLNNQNSAANKIKLQQSINQYIERIEAAIGRENGKRKMVYGDIDGDKDDDIVIHTSFQYDDPSESKIETIILFIKDNEFYQGVAYQGVGGTYSGKFNLIKITDKKIYGELLCCKESMSIEQCKKVNKTDGVSIQYTYKNGEIIGRKNPENLR